MAVTQKKWVGLTEACRLLGVTRNRLEDLAREKRVRVAWPHAGDRTRRFSGEDIEALRNIPASDSADVVDMGVGFNLKGRVPDWSHQTFLARLDSCWYFLMAHGYIEKTESDAIRARIDADRGER